VRWERAIQSCDHNIYFNDDKVIGSLKNPSHNAKLAIGFVAIVVQDEE
jgi:hypothetical protein